MKTGAKKPEAEYAVKFKGRRLVDEYRGDRIDGRVFEILKDEGGRITHYEVVLSTIGDWCDCPAGHLGRRCKHLEMAYEHWTKENCE